MNKVLKGIVAVVSAAAMAIAGFAGASTAMADPDTAFYTITVNETNDNHNFNAYQVFKGERNIGRDHAIMLAFGLRCSLVETQRLLRLAGVSELWCKVRRDAIIIFCLQHGMTRAECDDELYRLGEPTLLTSEG